MRYSSDIPTCDQLLTLYADAGWTGYTSDCERLLMALERSLYVVTAWEGEELAGLARAVGDGETILYIQDILVSSSFHHSGIGMQLISMVLRAYPDVRQVVLLTDDSPANADFYASLGFTRAEARGCAAYVQFR